jgi:hypothetical protein
MILGKFAVGDRVKPRTATDTRRGTVVQVTAGRVRVLWDAQAHGRTAKRTWWAKARLIQIIEVPDPFPEPDDRPAVGPGGWCLDTDE